MQDGVEVKASVCSVATIIGKLLKLKMLSEAAMHSCVQRFLKHHHDEESLECL